MSRLAMCLMMSCDGSNPNVSIYRERSPLTCIYRFGHSSFVGIKCAFFLLAYSALVLGCMVYSLSLAPRVFRQGTWHSHAWQLSYGYSILSEKVLLGFSPSCGRVSQVTSGVLLCIVYLLVILILLLLHIYVTGLVYVSVDEKMIMKVERSEHAWNFHITRIKFFDDEPARDREIHAHGPPAPIQDQVLGIRWCSFCRPWSLFTEYAMWFY